MPLDKKIGVYLCSGCDIGKAIDLEKLARVATDEYHVAVCRQNPSFCGREGLDAVRADLDKEGVNAVVIGACSPRVLIEVFRFPDDILLERVNLREQVAWGMPPGEEDTQATAEDYLRMGIVKIQKASLPEPFVEEIDRSILVVGGGVAGLHAALEAARAGYDVTLIECGTELGGWMRRQARAYPTAPPYDELHDAEIDGLIQAAEGDERVRILCDTQIERISGAPGMFDVTARANGAQETFRVGAVIQATGWKPYDANRLGNLGYGRVADVVTSIELEEMARDGAITRPSDGQQPQSVVFLQCAGSRDPEHLPYCSAVCCMATLKQATYLKEANPETEVYIVYKDIRTPGQYEDFYRRVQKDGAVFVKGDPLAVSESDGKVHVQVQDVLLGDTLDLEADLLVLATGMVPSMALDEDLAPRVEHVETQAPGSEEGEAPVVEMVTGPGMALHLAYRQGPELPKLKYGMPDSHFICFPYETRRTGIYSAGCVRQPMDSLGAREDAAGAALKAVQSIEMTARGEAVHPRAGDRSFPEFFMQRCTQCKRCTEECPFGAINEDEKANPLPNITRCRRCSICMGSCPERIISFKDYSVDMIGSMIKAIDVPEEDEEKPRILVFACENDAYPALDMLGRRHLPLNPFVRVIPMRCLGSLNLVWIADALSKGIDGILLLGCRHGDDYQCHMIKGSELAAYRLSKVSETLDRLALESARVHMEEIEITDFGKLPAIMERFSERLVEIGPNPYKGF
jgi:quinone-modifying oxidoreductase subunit QmoB